MYLKSSAEFRPWVALGFEKAEAIREVYREGDSCDLVVDIATEFLEAAGTAIELERANLRMQTRLKAKPILTPPFSRMLDQEVA